MDLAEREPEPKMLFGEFWSQGELCILFADTNVGKSVLAVQIANSITRHRPIRPFALKARSAKVLYVDFELSTQQFYTRYRDEKGNYNFNEKFIRAGFNPGADMPPEGYSYDDYVIAGIEYKIQLVRAGVLIIDNITCLRGGIENAAVALALTVAFATAHMVYVVPAKDAKTATIVFSDSLDPDEEVPIEKIKALKLTAVAGGKAAAVEHKTEKHSLSATLPADTKLVYGSVTYGLFTRGEKPALLVYHPKAILGGATGKDATVGEKAATEIVPVADGGKVKFQFIVSGKPVAEADVNVALPDGKKEKVKTDKEGFTPAFDAAGRYAVYAKHVETKAGEVDGKKYEQVSHYATLVADAPAKAK